MVAPNLMVQSLHMIRRNQNEINGNWKWFYTDGLSLEGDEVSTYQDSLDLGKPLVEVWATLPIANYREHSKLSSQFWFFGQNQNCTAF